MTGVAIVVEPNGVERLQKKMQMLSLHGAYELLDALGAQIESQVRRRISEERADADGTPWPAWSIDYAATRRGGHALLVASGALIDSITHHVNGSSVEIGTNLVYAAIHQFGGESVGMPVPSRPFLGLSADNLADLEALLDEWADQQARRV